MARAKVKPTQRGSDRSGGQPKRNRGASPRKKSSRGHAKTSSGTPRSPSFGRRSGTAGRPGEMVRAERRRRGKKAVRRPVRA